MDLTWQDDWPTMTDVHDEVEAFVDGAYAVLMDIVPAKAWRGLYYKGSALKSWESALDYVPEISDVDLHIWLQTDEDAEALFGSMEVALEVQAGLEREYKARVVDPIHFPRPQLMRMNRLVKGPNYVSPGPNVIRHLHGEPCPFKPYETDKMLRGDCEMALENAGFGDRLAGSAIDKPDRFLWKILRDLVFRVSPSGPRAVHLLGASTVFAWESNRTHIHQELIDRDHSDLAEAYAQYYLAGWRYFLSKWTDTDAGREAVREGIRVLEMTAGIARDWQAANGGVSG